MKRWEPFGQPYIRCSCGARVKYKHRAHFDRCPALAEIRSRPPRSMLIGDSIISNGVHTLVKYDDNGHEVSREVTSTGCNSISEQMLRAVVDPEWETLCKPAFGFSVHGGVK